MWFVRIQVHLCYEDTWTSSTLAFIFLVAVISVGVKRYRGCLKSSTLLGGLNIDSQCHCTEPIPEENDDNTEVGAISSTPLRSRAY